jgi:hypothetical protein
MNIKPLTSKSGIFSGVVIPVEELNDVKNSIKNNTEFYRIISGLLSKRKSSAQKEEIMFSSGLNGLQLEEEAKKITDKIYMDAFSKGIPMFYQDDRTKGLKQFIRANPDGSEDLVSFDSPSREYTLIRNLALAGEGPWSYLISA